MIMAAKDLVLTVKLLESDKIIQAKIFLAMARELRKIFTRSRERIQKALRKFVRDTMVTQPEIRELNGGILQGAFGLKRGTEARVIEDIINAISSSVHVELEEVSPVGGKDLRGGMSIYIQPSDFSNLLTLSSGIVKTERLDHLPWLRWLLTEGDRVLIGDVEVKYKSGTGRSTLATMQKSGVFRVPPSYSGTEDNNFITRAFAESEGSLTYLIQNNLR
jgi:hypothetical protein